MARPGGAPGGRRGLKDGDATLVMGLTEPEGGASYLQAIAATGRSYGDLLANPDGGNVGIRTRTPSAELDVNGTVKATRIEGDGSGLSNVPGTLRSTGIVTAWGLGVYGQTTVPSGLKNVIAIAAGAGHTLALKDDGTVVAWGNNELGQSAVPSGLSGVTAIDAGDWHSVALKSDGTLVAWGAGSEECTFEPNLSVCANKHAYRQAMVPTGLKNVMAIAAGGDSTGVIMRRQAVIDDLLVAGSVTATAFNTTSDRNAKESFSPVDPQTVLAKVAAMPISQWNFKGKPGEVHVGPMAQDFHAAFGLGADDRHIATVDADGVALAAIQGLHQQVRQLNGLQREASDDQREQRVQIEALRLENVELRGGLSHLEDLLQQLSRGIKSGELH